MVGSDSTTNQIKYAYHKKGGGWTSEVITDTEGGAAFYSMVFGSIGSLGTIAPAVSYYDAFAGDLKVATRSQGITTNWDVTELAAKGAVGSYSSVGIFDQTDSTSLPQTYAYDKSTDSVVFVIRFNPKQAYHGFSDTGEPYKLIAHGGRYLSMARDVRLDIISTDAAYFDTDLNALHIGTVFPLLDDKIPPLTVPE